MPGNYRLVAVEQDGGKMPPSLLDWGELVIGQASELERQRHAIIWLIRVRRFVFDIQFANFLNECRSS